MAGGMKRLAGETAIYGVSSIVGKFLNWFRCTRVYWLPRAISGL